MLKVRGGFTHNHIKSTVLLMFTHCYIDLFSEPMKKMFLKLILFCLCLWRLDGEFEISFCGFYSFCSSMQ